MNINFKRCVTGFFCALFLSATTAYAAPQGKGYGPKGENRRDLMEGRFKRMGKEIGITAEQEKKLEAHRKTHREQSRQLFEQMRQKREALQAEIEKPDMNMSQVNALQAELKSVQEKLADQRLEGILEVRKILTPEQFKKFHEITRREGRRGGARGNGKGRGPGRGLEADAGPDEEDASPAK